MSTDELRVCVMEFLKSFVDAAAGAPTIDDKDVFMDSGMDSLSIVEYRNTIQDEFKVKVDADVLFNYPNILSLTKFIVSLLDQNQESKKTDDEENVENTKDNDVCVSESDVVNILLDFYRSKNKKEVFVVTVGKSSKENITYRRT